jgi:putative SOS response-associated peptidase YedK
MGLSSLPRFEGTCRGRAKDAGARRRAGACAGAWSRNGGRSLKELPATLHARCGMVADKPMFRSALKARRSILPISGYYEWTARPAKLTTSAGRVAGSSRSPASGGLARVEARQQACNDDEATLIEASAA